MRVPFKSNTQLSGKKGATLNWVGKKDKDTKNAERNIKQRYKRYPNWKNVYSGATVSCGSLLKAK